ncbi:hypothetical protein YYC_00018 [Plasmodium yoelii 17X]|uniref:Uncharacterized protein n=1 Tax=Plasmodium yoelii 17X TaxID=1323249 RepID=V7PVD1_PLAYE|nr:hypothetical protein YYC_00018 [Plasmodium yoelii 17X]
MNIVEHLTNIYLNSYIKKGNISYLSPLKGQYNNIFTYSLLLYFKTSPICKRFKNVRGWISDELEGKGIPEFNVDNYLNNYCDSKQCQGDYDRISAGCLYLLEEFFGNSESFQSVAKGNTNIVDYILIWLSYMLNLNKNEGHESIKIFYNYQINSCDKYKARINEFTEYESYKDLINRNNYFLSMDINIISKFYNPFKSLCEMYNELDDNKNCKKCLEDNNEFFKKYELKQDTSITGNNSYNQLFSTLSNDYDNLKKKCNVNCSNSLSSPTIEKAENDGQISTQNSDVTSSSSIVSKLIPVLSIFGAISIFLGISYKYSLFGFRKRSQKQHLREKLKK